MSPSVVSRRVFLGKAGLCLGWALVAPRLETAAGPLKPRRAGIIGDTGRGNYGHGFDLAFREFSNVEVVALADPDPTGRAQAAQSCAAQRQYADFREMLATEKPELVVIAPRWSEGHHEIALAALGAGAHLLIEKPFTATLAQADEILKVAVGSGRKIAVAHQMRLAPILTHLRRRLTDGLVGEVAQVRSWGKQDSRAGGEDMMVLGTHLFDMMRFLIGDARWCAASVCAQGHQISHADARAASERIGPVAGDEIEATFGFDKGVTATFTSRGRLRETLGRWGMELVGTKGAVRVLMDIDPLVLLRRRNDLKSQGTTEEWRPLQGDAQLPGPPGEQGFGPANRRLVSDWLDAIDRDREPECSGHNAMKAVEMVMAVYESSLSGRRVSLPLVRRDHPLTQA